MTHITNTDFQYSGAQGLLNYISKDEHDLENRVGQSMTETEKEAFIAKSDYFDFERHFIISPEDNDLSDREIAEATRNSVNGYFADASTVDFCYAVHRDSDSLHAHVALTGEKDDLYMNQKHIKEFNERSEELFLEQERTLENELHRENGLQNDRGHERGPQLGRELGR